jgi:hypothetical protein
MTLVYHDMQPPPAATTYGNRHVMSVGRQNARTEPSARLMMLLTSQDPAELTRCSVKTQQIAERSSRILPNYGLVAFYTRPMESISGKNTQKETCCLYSNGVA